ncbi:MAG: hypothetical protein QM484_07140 [Woeseiaceae bacterium]
MKTAKKQVIFINQLLYGYDEGHRLLAGSIKPKKQSAQTLLALSDLSGQSIEGPNDTYITGYPIPEMDKYALARTWLAPEMSRPGCVWTHTILIDFSDLAAIESSAILDLFQHPFNKEDLSVYNQTIEIEICNSNNIHPFLYQEDVTGLVDAIYSSPEDSIFVQEQDSCSSDNIALAIWLQQWPRLRRNFRFCTWAPSDRSRTDEKFDLQFVPNKQFFKESRRKQNKKLWIDIKSTPINSYEYWAEIVAEDLITRNRNSSLQKFLWRYGAEIEAGRAAFKPLTMIWLSLKSHSHIDLTTAVKAANNLNQNINSLSSSIAEEVAQSLGGLTSPPITTVEFLAHNLSLVDKHIITEHSKTIATAIWNQIPEYIWPLFEDKSLASYVIATDAAKLMQPEDVIKKSSGDIDLLTTILDANKELFNSSLIWDAPEPIPSLAADILSSYNEPNKNILNAMFEAKNDKVPEIGIDIFEQDAVNMAVDFLEERRSDKKLQACRWIMAAKKFPDLLLNFINQRTNIHLETLAFIASLVKYNHKPVSNNRDEWAKAVESAKGELKHGAFEFYSFLFKRALSGVSPEPGSLICNSFDQLHESLLLSRVDVKSWKDLENELPDVEIWKTWDKAYKIRLGLVAVSIERDISPKEFLTFTNDIKTFKVLVDIALHTSPGFKYIEKLYLWSQKPKVKVATERKTIIEKAIKKHRVKYL